MCRQVCIFSSFALAAEDPVEEKSDRSSLLSSSWLSGILYWPSIIIPLSVIMTRNMVLAYFDYIFTCIFAIEMFLKILDLGVILHPGSYCRFTFNNIAISSWYRHCWKHFVCFVSFQGLLEHYGRNCGLLCPPCLDVCVSLNYHDYGISQPISHFSSGEVVENLNNLLSPIQIKI